MHGSMEHSTLYMTHFSFETSETLEATLSLSYFELFQISISAIATSLAHSLA